MINRFINILMGSFIGLFIGSSIYKFFHFKNNPELYAMQSAPWYTGIQIEAIALIIFLLICFAIKMIIKHRNRK